MSAVLICFFHPKDHRMGPVRECRLCVGLRDYPKPAVKEAA